MTDPQKKMLAMTDMSRTIRAETLRHAPHLQTIPDDILDGYVEIMGAYLGDFKGEQERRKKERRQR